MSLPAENQYRIEAGSRPRRLDPVRYTRATFPTAPAKVEILRRPNGRETATALAREEIQFDGFGRVWKERRLMPAIGWSTRESRYNAMGWKIQVSEYTTGTPTHWTQYLDYDPFGRPGTIRPPDGSAHDVALSYTGVRLFTRTSQVGTARAGDGPILESPSVTTEEYDRQGRLWKVTEPSGSVRIGIDAAGNVTRVRRIPK